MGSLADLVRQYTPETTFLGQQHDYLKSNQLITNPEEACINISKALDPNSELGKEFAKLRDTINYLSEAFILDGALKDMAENDALVCEMSIAESPAIEKAQKKGEIKGFATKHMHIAGVNTQSTGQTRTAAEEFVHLYQSAEPLDDKKYSGAEVFFWHLGLESQAKLSVAVAAAQEKLDGNFAIYNAHDFYDSDGQDRATSFLTKKAQEIGAEALSDPEILFKAYTIIMGSTNFVSDYYNLRADYYSNLKGTQSIDIDTFSKAFGTIVGDDPSNNFMKGNIQSKADIIALMNETYRHENGWKSNTRLLKDNQI